MNLNNLTKNNERNTNRYYNFKNSDNNEKELEITENQMIIPKHKLAQLKKSSGFFNVFIDRDFTNSYDYFDNDGNYIFKKELLPKKFIYYGENANNDYVFSRNQVWKALPNVLTDGHIPDPILAELIADWFMFNTDSLYNPTLAESETVPKPSGFYKAAPSKKQLQRLRKLNRELGINNNNNYNIPYYLIGRPKPTREELFANLTKEKRKEKMLELKRELIKNKKLNMEDFAEMLFNKTMNISRALNETKKATSNRTKYGKSKTISKKPLKEMRKEKRRTQRRKMAIARKTMKQTFNNTNELNNNNEYNNEFNINE